MTSCKMSPSASAYCHALATSMHAPTSRADPSAFRYRSRLVPPLEPDPSAIFRTTLLAARRICRASRTWFRRPACPACDPRARAREVIPASTEPIDRAEKLTIYARERVAHAWLVNPLVQTLEVYRLDGEGWRLVATWHGDAKVRAEPFDAIELELAALWAR
jgi:hypothetical protein